MFTSADIVVLILIIGSGILIWVARSSRFEQRTDSSRAHGHENPPSAEQMETHGETNNHTNHDQSEKKDTSSN